MASSTHLPCESCGSSSLFHKDQAGFFICIDCGQQQSDVREEYRDEDDLAYEQTGVRGYEEGFGAQRVRNRTLQSVTARRGGDGKDDSEIEDYNNAIEDGEFDSEWPVKPPSENDFLRAFQTLLMWTVRGMISKFRLTEVLDGECRKIWLQVLKYYIESDYPADTFFAFLRRARAMIGLRRLYSPTVVPQDPNVVLDDPNVSIEMKDTVRHMDLDRINYARRISIYSTWHDKRPEVVRVRQGRIKIRPVVDFKITELDHSTKETSSKKRKLRLQQQDKASKKPKLATNSASATLTACSYTDDSSELSHHSRMSTTSLKHSSKRSSNFKSKAETSQTRQASIHDKSNESSEVSEQDSIDLPTRENCSDLESNCNSRRTRMSSNDVSMPSDSSSGRHFSRTRRKASRAVRESSKLRISDEPVSEGTENSSDHFEYGRKQYSVAADAYRDDERPYYQVSRCDGLEPPKNQRIRLKKAFEEKGRKAPKFCEKSSRYRKISRYMRADPQQKFTKFEKRSRWPAKRGIPDRDLTIMLNERLLPTGRWCDPTEGVDSSVRASYVVAPKTAGGMIRIKDPKYQMDLVYEHDFMVHVIETRTVLLTKSADDDKKQHSQVIDGHAVTLDSDEMINSNGESYFSAAVSQETYRDTSNFEGKQNPEKATITANVECLSKEAENARNKKYETLEQRRQEVNAVLELNLTGADVKSLIDNDPDVQSAAEYWKKKGVQLRGGKIKARELNETIPLTKSREHRAVFRQKELKHELSPEAVLERIVRGWQRKVKEEVIKKEKAVEGADIDDHEDGSADLVVVSNHTDKEQENSNENRSDKKSRNVQSPMSTMKKKLTISGSQTKRISPTDRTKLNEAGHLVPNANSSSKIVNSLLSSYLKRIKEDVNSRSCQLHVEQKAQPNGIEPECKEEIVPIKRLDPFYHRGQREVRYAVAQSGEQFAVMRDRLGLVKQESSAEIFNNLTTKPPLSMAGTRVLQSNEIVEELRDIYLKQNNQVQLKFLPVLKFMMMTGRTTREYARAAALRELFQKSVPPYVLRGRLFDDSPHFEPPPIDHTLLITILWVALLNTRHSILAIDMCRWIECGTVPLHEAIHRIPVWLFEAGGFFDMTRHKAMHERDVQWRTTKCPDRSIFQLQNSIKPEVIERTAQNLKLMGIYIAPFCYRALIPRLIHHCCLPTYIQALVVSLLKMIEHPLTQYQDGYGPIIDENNEKFKFQLYGKVGTYAAPVTTAAALLIVCRMVWPIFVYQPLGHPGVINEDQTCRMTSKPGLDLYKPASEEQFDQEPLIRFDLASSCWIAVINDNERSLFDSKRIGFVESGIEALSWIKKKSIEDFKRLLLSFQHLQNHCLTNYCDARLLSRPKAPNHFDIDPLLIEFFNRGHRELIHESQKTQASNNDRDSNQSTENLHPPFAFLLKWLPTNQELYKNLVIKASKPGWLDSLPPWLFANDAWNEASPCEKQQWMLHISNYIHRPTLPKGEFRNLGLRLSEYLATASYPSLGAEIDAALNEFLSDPAYRETEERHRDEKMNHIIDNYYADETIEVTSIEDFFPILYKVYLQSLSSTFQEPPMPTRCFHPIDLSRRLEVKSNLLVKKENDHPLEEYRFPVPYAILLRRLGSFINDDHLHLHKVTSELERWLFIAEVPERFVLQLKNNEATSSNAIKKGTPSNN